ncbi:hypothetical protein GCM10017044_08060 [Kordiimonas sediminis]|uniref:UPF0260 protein GCM10017044_08060 n=1 Tax=Kordiimonas sediminis TaxID=1735581 RepID=A0A919E3L3_9PROT|nr:YcgN family cysteine cluster protein [Kordiimonas sediminis]GHF16173.1 hypothetical protein GCM10017044_08060 [Kordiimonas sediminis]
MAFWQEKSLQDMTPSEWESLCDGCGKCCLHKLEDEDTGEVYFTNVACRMLDLESVRCKKYENRQRYVANCMVLTPDLGDRFRWMPATCAYRLLSEGKDLPDWHPLKSGDPAGAEKAGYSVHGRAVDERDAGDYEDHIVDWPQDT